MEPIELSRRQFLTTGSVVAMGAATGLPGWSAAKKKPVVSIVKIKNDRIDIAVEKAIEFLGGMRSITKGKDRIMLKPNLVVPNPNATTKPEVIRTLARLMNNARKEVLIGEGSGSGPGLSGAAAKELRFTRKKAILDGMQQGVFDKLGYSDLARSLRVPLVNLHSGEMVEVNVPGGFVFDKLTIHRSLADIDLLCSVPMMKTHVLAGVTLGMKNLIGLYPGTVYAALRVPVHDLAAKVEPYAAAPAIVDMVRANKLGLVVVDGSTAMEGDGPAGGPLVKMDLIVAGTNALATDMVTASLMGFEPAEISTFAWANKAGMTPSSLDEIELRGEKPDRVRRRFVKPNLVAWETVRKSFALSEV